jgi:subtilisin family serine protease
MAEVQVQFGGRGGSVYSLATNDDLVAIRTRDGGPVLETPLSGTSHRLLDKLEPIVRFRDAGVEVFHVRDGSMSTRDEVRATLTKESSIRFAGRVLADPVFRPEVAIAASQPAAPALKEPILYSENIFVKFDTTATAAKAKKVLAAVGLKIKRPVDYVEHAYFAEAPEGTGLEVFNIALRLLRDIESVEYCHPELLRPRQLRSAFPQQWHLKKTTINGTSIDAHASVTDAWKLTEGKGITIAIIDTGIDIDHEEFTGTGKIVKPRDTTVGVLDPSDPRPQSSRDEKHGTACAGVACANGKKGASGVAPLARLMPIRLMAGLGSQSEADAFAWAADNGADVISCSWGPVDGRWFEPDHPGHRATVPLPDNTRLAIEYALTKGRNNKGCVICWAAGNGNESVDNDGYASFPGVVAVAACNDTGKRSVYSDTGKALWCSFPSGDSALDAVAVLPTPPPIGGVWNVNHPPPKTAGIWTTDWSGAMGYNGGGSTLKGDMDGHYTNSFGGTSSSTPGVAGVAALILSLKPSLRQEDVRDIIKRSCDQIDLANGQYDATTGHSQLYGFGRVNAAKAVALVAAPKSASPKAASPKSASMKSASAKAASRKSAPRTGPRRRLAKKR